MRFPVLVLIATVAHAQETTPPPMPAPEPVTAPPPVEMQVPVQVPQNLGNAVLADPGNRFRWGISGNIGALAPGSGFAPALGVDARFGWQFSNAFSLYAIIGATGGIQFSDTNNGLFNQYVGADVEWMVADLFFVAVGPVASNASFRTTLINTGLPGVSSIEAQASGPRFSLDARAGFHLGSINPQTWRRSGFSIGVQAMTTFYGGAQLTEVRTDGSRRSSIGLAVGVVPMLMLGYDAR